MKKKIERYSSLFEEENKQPLQEMVTVGVMDDFTILVYTDHNPPHFHLLKKGEFEAKINIETLEVFGYKFQRSGKTVRGSDLRKLKKCLNQTSSKNKKNTNKEIIEISWSILNS